MSDAEPNGPATTDVSVMPPRGMITIRGDLKSKNLNKAVLELVEEGVPTPGKINLSDNSGCAWMSPDELLLMVGSSVAQQALVTVERALAGEHNLVTNVSDARAIIQIKGDNVRDVLAKLTPSDVSPAAFGVGDMRRSRIAQVAGAFWMLDARTVELVCFRSSAGYVAGLLKQASRLGAEPEFH